MSDQALIYLVIASTRERMPTLLFIPGKNWRLSLAELVAFLEARSIKFVVSSISKEFFVFNVEGDGNGWAMADLGGFIKIGSATANLATEAVKKAFLQQD